MMLQMLKILSPRVSLKPLLELAIALLPPLHDALFCRFLHDSVGRKQQDDADYGSEHTDGCTVGETANIDTVVQCIQVQHFGLVRYERVT